MVAVRHRAFSNSKLLTAGKVNGPILHHPAKVCEYWSSFRRDIAIFRFFNTAAAAILDFTEIRNFNGQSAAWGQWHHRAKFRQNRSNRL